MTDSIKQQLEFKIRHMIKSRKIYDCPIINCEHSSKIKLAMIDHVIQKHTFDDIFDEKEK